MEPQGPLVVTPGSQSSGLAGIVTLLIHLTHPLQDRSESAPTDAFLWPRFTGKIPSPGSLAPGLPGLKPRMPHF